MTFFRAFSHELAKAAMEETSGSPELGTPGQRPGQDAPTLKNLGGVEDIPKGNPLPPRLRRRLTLCALNAKSQVYSS